MLESDGRRDILILQRADQVKPRNSLRCLLQQSEYVRACAVQPFIHQFLYEQQQLSLTQKRTSLASVFVFVLFCFCHTAIYVITKPKLFFSLPLFLTPLPPPPLQNLSPPHTPTSLTQSRNSDIIFNMM